MTTRSFLALILLTACLAAPVGAAEAPIEGLPDGRPATLACDTSVWWLDTSPFASSKGRIELTLTFTGRDGDTRNGTWSVASVDDAHEHSFARRTNQQCAGGCVLRLTVAETAGGDNNTGRQLELWAPNPTGIDKLADDQELSLATFKLPSLDLKVSMFRGRTPLGFESGTCTMTSDAASPPPTQPTDNKATRQ